MRRTYNVKLPFLSLTGVSGLVFAFCLVFLLPLCFVLGIGLVMVMFGVVHSYWPTIPALSFWQTFGVYVLAQLLTHKSSSK